MNHPKKLSVDFCDEMNTHQCLYCEQRNERKGDSQKNEFLSVEEERSPSENEKEDRGLNGREPVVSGSNPTLKFSFIKYKISFFFG